MRFMARSGATITVLGVLMALTLAAMMPAAALGSPAATVSSHRVSLAGEIETLSSTGTIGMAGVMDTDAGILDGSVSGSPRWSGALRQVVTWGPALSIRAKGTAFDADGALRFTLAGRFAAGTTGLRLTGTLTVTGGTGSFSHAHGRLRVTGRALIGGGATRSTLHLSGSLRYPRPGR